MNSNNWSHLWHNSELNLSFFQAFHPVHSYPRHSHDYYVVAVVDKGLQSFRFGNSKQITPVNGLILLNPGDMHTGEPVNELGFGYSAFYPTVEHMEAASRELPGAPAVPDFSVPRADDIQMAQLLRSLHITLKSSTSLLECESKFLLTLVELIRRFGDRPPRDIPSGCEHPAVKKVRNYIHENYSRSIALPELAEYVNFSRYYLLRIFREEMGMPPHTYLENIRIRQAQRLLSEGTALVQVAGLAGFSSQSHFTRSFKQIIGITPGEYARQVKK